MNTRKKIIRRVVDAASIPYASAIHPLLARIYAARKVQSLKEADRALQNLLPFSDLLGIDRAVDVLSEALQEQKRILIVGDFDADGATSTTLAVRALKSFGAQHVDFLVPNRFAYGYGLTPELIEAAHDYAPQLIMTVDNGIANHAGVKAAKEKGIQVVITDHHLPAATLPEADAIVNPNQFGCTFASKNLAGVGVVFYVMLALRRHLVVQGWFTQHNIPEPNMSRLLDLVALGTVADLVQLDHNNRILVHQGLLRIRAGQCIPGIVALLELAGRDFTKVVAADLGFAVGARLNAAGRLDDMSLGIACLLSDDAVDARVKAQTLDQLNDERKGIEQGMQAQALKALDKLNINSGELPIGLCLFDESWHQGVIGILASRIKDRFHRPVIAFAKGLENEIKGSARSIPGLHIRDVLAAVDAQHPGLIMKFGGHAMAAGLTLAIDSLADFSKAFNALVSAQVSSAQLEHCLLSDGELAPDDFNIEVADLLREAGPWGQSFPEPLFDDTFEIVEQRIIADRHLKLRLLKNKQVIDAISFFIDTNTWPNHRYSHVHAAYRLDVNEYKGRRTMQLIVEYMEPV